MPMWTNLCGTNKTLSQTANSWAQSRHKEQKYGLCHCTSLHPSQPWFMRIFEILGHRQNYTSSKRWGLGKNIAQTWSILDTHSQHSGAKWSQWGIMPFFLSLSLLWLFHFGVWCFVSYFVFPFLSLFLSLSLNLFHRTWQMTCQNISGVPLLANCFWPTPHQ